MSFVRGLVSDTPKGAVRLGFPSTVIERWFPGLYQPRPGTVDAKEAGVPAVSTVGESAAMTKELGSRVARRGWSAPDNFDETIAIYADQGTLAAMLADVWKTDTLKDLLDIHHIEVPDLANN